MLRNFLALKMYIKMMEFQIKENPFSELGFPDLFIF